MWMKENFPGPKWVVSNTILMDDYGWSFVTIGETVVVWWIYRDLISINAADPEFFSKLKACIEEKMEARGVLYKAADMEMTKPKYTC